MIYHSRLNRHRRSLFEEDEHKTYKPKTKRELRKLLIKDKVDCELIDISNFDNLRSVLSDINFDRYPNLENIGSWDISHITDLSFCFNRSKKHSRKCW